MSVEDPSFEKLEQKVSWGEVQESVPMSKAPKTIGNFRIPAWWECGWRRVGCGKDTCMLCGRIARDRKKHLEKGEDADDMESVVEDVGGSFAEALNMIKTHAESMGIDIANIDTIKEPPMPERFSLYRKTHRWRTSVDALFEEAEEEGEFWIATEAAADVAWYKDIIPAKTYRQLSNRWHIEQEDEYGDVDYRYTNYVLGECLRILKKSLHDLALFKSSQKAGFMVALAHLSAMEQEIVSI